MADASSDSLKLPDVALPPASALPPGTMVLSVDGTSRTKLRTGIALLAAGLFAAGVATGRITAPKTKGRTR
jgi:hypothetical protein